MNGKELSGKEGGESVDEQRARWEEFSMVVCRNGVVNVVNRSYGAEEVKNHTYSVMLAGGAVIRCSCPHHRKRGARCKHMIAVEDRPLVVSSAKAASASRKQVAADGGERR